MSVMLASTQLRDALGMHKEPRKWECLPFPWDLILKSLIADNAAGFTVGLKLDLQAHNKNPRQGQGLAVGGLRR